MMRAVGIVPPTPQCINLNPNPNSTATDCIVYWSHPNLYEGIEKIFVMISTSPDGPYQIGATVNAGDTVCSAQFNIGSLGSEVDDLYCYLHVTPNASHSSEGEADSDTLRSMRMQLISNYNNSVAILSWESPELPSGCDGQNYHIWRKTSNRLSRIAQVSQNTHTYRDTIDICEDYIQYFVSISNYYSTLNPACQFKTRPHGKIFYDKTEPHTPILDSVSVDEATQRIELGWTQTSPDAIGCIIYRVNNPGDPGDSITTVIGSHWISPDQQGNELHYYRIAAIDSCFESPLPGGTKAGPMTAPQNNIVLSLDGMNVCRKKIKLKWNSYTNMTGHIGQYQIFYSKDHGNMQYLASVSANDNRYECNNLPTNHNYTFIVRAINANGRITAASCQCEVTDYTEEASDDLCYIRHVSVLENQAVEILVLTDTPFTELHFYRSVNDTLHFNKIATINYQNGVSEYSYKDPNADVTGSINHYKVSLRNECGAESAISNIAHTILLKGEGNTAQENYLQWNNYGEFNGGTKSYKIYRRVETIPDFTDIENSLMANEHNSYSDHVADLFETGSRFQYYVVAQEGLNEYGFSDESRSNILEVRQFPNTYIPNAFCPNSNYEENKVFKPVNSFMSTEGYQLAIYSRQGELVFLTTDINQGWDGTEQYSGKAVPTGMYIYHMVYIRSDNQKVVKKGTVMLIN
ncbi:MAG: gliding motility-associated C-terminal domain-containing protein [Bacteroidales bacterium]|nr:gliding motility-associated C-terminal domain-containing protein [Bacteroidales bacterium]